MTKNGKSRKFTGLKGGKLNGKVQTDPVACPKCGRTILKGQNKCLYCGAALPEDPFRR